MIEPTHGRIVWDGTPLKSKRKTTLRRQMGYVIQNGGLFPHRTVVDNVGTVPGLLGWDKTKTRNRSMELLDAVGLDRKLAERYPAQLSGGQQQRVGVARALAADPLVMLMDEPFSAVDPVVRSELHELFLNLQRELSKTIILITHDIDEAIKLGDQVAILRVGGHLAQVGTPQELLDEPADAFVEGFVGRDRGFRALSFLPSARLSLGRVRAVRDPSSARSAEPTLVVDAEAKPLGWADSRNPGHVLALGSTFDPENDSLRVALDAALTSPVGIAVALSRDRYAGVVRAEDILAQATDSRASQAEAVALREHGEAPSPVDEPSGSVDPSPAAAEPEPPTETAARPVPETHQPDRHDDASVPAGTDVQNEAGVQDAADSGGATAIPEQQTTEQPTTEQPTAEQPTTQVAYAGDVPVQVDRGTAPEPTEPAARPQGAHAVGPANSSGRGSQEPGSPSDELDMDRSWNPFKRPQ